MAASEGFVKATKVLLNAGADMTLRTSELHFTALDLAMSEGKNDTALLLTSWDPTWSTRDEHVVVTGWNDEEDTELSIDAWTVLDVGRFLSRILFAIFSTFFTIL